MVIDVNQAVTGNLDAVMGYRDVVTYYLASVTLDC